MSTWQVAWEAAAGRLHGKQLLAGCTKAALLAARRGRQVGDSPPIDSNKQLIKEKREIRRGRKRKERRKREGGG